MTPFYDFKSDDQGRKAEDHGVVVITSGIT